MVVHQPILIQEATGDPTLVTTAQEFRNYSRALLALADFGSGFQGVTATSAYQVTQRGAGANLSVDVASGNAFVFGDDVTGQGSYHCWNDATVNVAGITVPGAGTFHHRIILQIEDHLTNGAWAAGTYAGVLLALLDTGGGLPAEPNSAITLATIDVPTGSSSVTNAMINDYRTVMGELSVTKAGDTSRGGSGSGNTTLSDDPDLVLTGFNTGVSYEIRGAIFYDGATLSNGDIKMTFRTGGGTGRYATSRIGFPGGAYVAGVAQNWTDTPAAGSQGVGNDQGVTIEGLFISGARPTVLAFQWAQQVSNSSVATRVRANSFLSARRRA